VVTARPATAVALLLLGGLLLTACVASGQPSASPPATPSRTASTPSSAPASPPPGESVAPTADPPVEPEPVTCDTILTPAALAALADAGLELRPDQDAGYPLVQQLAAAGGTACLWAKAQSDVHLVAAQIPVAPGEQDAWARVLGENGYTRTDDPVAGAFVGPIEPGTGLSPVVVLEPARMSFVSAPTLVTDLAPAP